MCLSDSLRLQLLPCSSWSSLSQWLSTCRGIRAWPFLSIMRLFQYSVFAYELYVRLDEALWDLSLSLTLSRLILVPAPFPFTVASQSKVFLHALLLTPPFTLRRHYFQYTPLFHHLLPRESLTDIQLKPHFHVGWKKREIIKGFSEKSNLF